MSDYVVTKTLHTPTSKVCTGPVHYPAIEYAIKTNGIVDEPTRQLYDDCGRLNSKKRITPAVGKYPPLQSICILLKKFLNIHSKFHFSFFNASDNNLPIAVFSLDDGGTSGTILLRDLYFALGFVFRVGFRRNTSVSVIFSSIIL